MTAEDLGKNGWAIVCNKYRFIILAIGVLCLTAIGCNYTVVNFTFICMTEDASDVIEYGNGTTRQRYDYTPTEKGYLIWAVAAGTFIGTFPINWAYVRWGARYPFFISGLLSALATSFSPQAAHSSIWLFVLLRFVQGLAYSADFAAIGIIVVRWAPLGQTAIFIACLTSFSILSTIITNPLAGIFCTTVGWRWAFYAHGGATVVLFTLWVLLYNDDPELHRAVSAKELKTIQKGKSEEHIHRDSFIPYKAVCSSMTVLVVWFNALAELVGLIIMLTYAPTYLNKVLGFSIVETAFWASLGSFLQFPLKFLGGIISDRVRFVPEVYKMQFFNTFAVAVAGMLCGMIGLMPTPLSAALCLTASVTLMGMNIGGFYKCATLHSRQYSHFVLATIQFSKCVALVIGPLMVAIFAHTDSDGQGWIIIFMINAALMMIANVLFYFTATDQPAEFTKITRQTWQ